MQHHEPDTISQASQGSIKFAVKVSALARVLIITASIGGFGAGLYGLPALFLLLLGLETGLSFVLGKYVLQNLDAIDLKRRFPLCSVSGRCVLLATANDVVQRVQRESQENYTRSALALAQSSTPRVREILFEVGESLHKHPQP